MPRAKIVAGRFIFIVFSYPLSFLLVGITDGSCVPALTLCHYQLCRGGRRMLPRHYRCTTLLVCASLHWGLREPLTSVFVPVWRVSMVRLFCIFGGSGQHRCCCDSSLFACRAWTPLFHHDWPVARLFSPQSMRLTLLFTLSSVWLVWSSTGRGRARAGPR